MSPDRSDDDEFRRLFDAHFDDLWRFARRRSPSAADADDITAHVFAVAWRRREEVPATDVRLWLFGVARHVLANHRRSNERRHRLQLRLIDNHRDDHEHDEALDLPRKDLRAALASLNDADRDVVLMRCWDGLAISDIAVVLGCTTNAVSVRLHKARRRLIDRLHQTDSDTNGPVSVDPQPRTKDRHGHQ